jgi:hypothetical protein
MQTERVTFLTSAEHKAMLDAFAAKSGRSVGHVLREASSQYMSEQKASGEKGEFEEALELILPELEAMLPKWHAQLDRMEANLDRAHRAVRDALAKVDGESE